MKKTKKMTSFDKTNRKVLVLQKCDIKCDELLKSFKNVVEMSFLKGNNQHHVDLVQCEIFKVLQHGFALNLDTNNCSSSTNNSCNLNDTMNCRNDEKFRVLQKLITDFEWVRIIVSAKHNTKVADPFSFMSAGNITTQHSYGHFLDWWLRFTLEDHCLCACLELLLNNKDLLTAYYNEEAFLRQDIYAIAFLMGLSAWEQQQRGFLIQMEKFLQLNNNIFGTRSKLFTSNPDIRTLSLNESEPSSQFPNIRKSKSLTNMDSNYNNNWNYDIQYAESKSVSNHHRLRCKTFNETFCKIDIIKQYSKLKQNVGISSAPTNTTSSSTSSISNKYGSDGTLNSSDSSALDSSSISCTSEPHVHLINTDNIKIWTDVSLEQKMEVKQHEKTQSCAIPSARHGRSEPDAWGINKSVSSINSFLSSLFGTPVSMNTEEEEQISCSCCHVGHQEREVKTALSANSIPNQPTAGTSVGSSVFDSFLPICGKKLQRNQNQIQGLFENGISCLDYSTPSTLPDVDVQKIEINMKDSKGNTESSNCESLTQFLQTSHLMHNNTQLERENAHFRISEAIISAMEQIKWNNSMSQRKQKATSIAADYFAAHKIAMPKQSQSTYCSELLEEEHTPYVELSERCTNSPTAELIGLSLISRFNEQHLPKVSELKWLVSEEDAPQKLLPLPKKAKMSDADTTVSAIIRGTKFWAPPRPQIIFTDHPSLNRKELLQKQNFRCAGCGMRVLLQDIHNFRYCTYLGKYHCTGCHRNHVSAIPAKILHTWDFKCYPVSVFAYRLLEQIYTFPLFYVPDLNPALYIKIEKLRKARHERLRLRFIRDFISSCRFAIENDENYFAGVPDHITNDVENWSLADFSDTQNGILQQLIERVIQKCENHIHNCLLCTARGFFCEVCQSEEVIFPWGANIKRCDQCGACYHGDCCKETLQNCSRCIRMDKRKDNILHNGI